MGLLSRSDVDRTVYKTPPVNVFRSDLLIGYNPAVSELAFEDIWPVGGIRTWITTPTVLDVTSDNAADSAAGTGARTISLVGLDANLDIITETIAMNGLSTVSTVQQFKRVSVADVVTSGTLNDSATNPNAGIITVKSGANTQMTIQATADGGSSGRQTGMHGSVGRGFNGYVDSLIVNADPREDISFNLYIRKIVDPVGGSFPARIQPLKVFMASGLGELTFPNPIVIPTEHDMWVTAKNIGVPGDVEVNVNAVLRLVKNA